jgi:undecaprenyl-diphosphatase
MDYQLFQWINGWAAPGLHPFLDLCMEGLTKLGPAIYVLVLLVLLLRREPNTSRTAGFYGFVTAFLALGINFVLGHLFYRPRPFVTHHVNLLLSHAADSSFPSDHTTGAFAIAFFLYRYNRRLGGILLVLAALIGLSRIYVGHHYPTDVLGGIVVAFIAAQVIYWAASRFSKKPSLFRSGSSAHMR